MKFLTRNFGFFFKLMPKSFYNNSYVKKAEEIQFFINLNKIIRNSKIDMVFDIGANIGSYSLILRKTGFNKKIIAFEPIKKYYLLAKKNLSKEKGILVENMALGNKTGFETINIASNGGQSSSILNFSKIPNIKKISTEKIKIITISDYIKEKNLTKKKLFLKLDVQGYELNVLKGIKDFSNIELIQLEMGFVNYYDGETLFEGLSDHMKKLNYRIVLIKTIGYKNSGEIQYMDVVFKKNN
ncbi:MAG: FkbM family methyltransferase [Nanoarchaeota archaeon]